jgi:3'-phosphoadenosine 5'-phosphosulfate sulfotransferase (PAPS reductase)/FAD synthetase
MTTIHHVLGISGGKDSAALAVYMRENFPELDIQYFFTDTGEELPEVYEFLGKLEGLLGKKINYLNPDRDFKFWLRHNGNFLPSPQTNETDTSFFEQLIKRKEVRTKIGIFFIFIDG